MATVNVDRQCRHTFVTKIAPYIYFRFIRDIVLEYPAFIGPLIL